MADDMFDAEWLALREAADHRSRACGLDAVLARAGARRAWSRVLDLGSGTGSNLRYLAPRLPWARCWTLLDHDAELLEHALEGGVPTQGSAEGFDTPKVTVVHGDLAAEGLEAIGSADLVTASALLDLVSREWLERAVEACAARGAGAFFVLSYDGGIGWRPLDPDDGLVRNAVNAHQRGEKGLGRALGPYAERVARELFAKAGYSTWTAPAPWKLSGPADRDLAEALVRGWVGAACETRPREADAVAAWGRRRGGVVRAGAYALEVGHRDVLALPGRARPR